MADVRLYEVMRRLFSQENLWALALALMLVALVIFTADSTPLWIYQGF
jgi:hypothetical protein